MGKIEKRPTQQEKFIEAARALGADEDEAAFKAKLAVIGKQKPAPHEITPAQRKKIEAEIAAAKVPRTADDVRADLVTAKAALAAWQRRFDNYSGNNPNKYQSDIRMARADIARLEAELGSGLITNS